MPKIYRAFISTLFWLLPIYIAFNIGVQAHFGRTTWAVAFGVLMWVQGICVGFEIAKRKHRRQPDPTQPEATDA